MAVRRSRLTTLCLALICLPALLSLAPVVRAADETFTHVQWEIPDEREGQGESLRATPDGGALFVNSPNYLPTLRKITRVGTIGWSVRVGRCCESGPVVDPRGVAYLVTNDGSNESPRHNLVGLKNGKRLWTIFLSTKAGQSSLVIGTDGRLHLSRWVERGANSIATYRRSDGKLLHTEDLSAPNRFPFYSYPVVPYRDGLVVVSNSGLDGRDFVEFMNQDGATTARYDLGPRSYYYKPGRPYQAPDGSVFVVGPASCNNLLDSNSNCYLHIDYATPTGGVAWSQDYLVGKYSTCGSGNCEDLAVARTPDGGLVLTARLSGDIATEDIGQVLTKINEAGLVEWRREAPVIGGERGAFRSPIFVDTWGDIRVAVTVDFSSSCAGSTPSDDCAEVYVVTYSTFTGAVRESRLLGRDLCRGSLLSEGASDFGQTVWRWSLYFCEDGSRDRLTSVPLPSSDAYPAAYLRPGAVERDDDIYRYVALGDSFSAGEGVKDFFEDGYDAVNNKFGVNNRCHRSNRAYSTKVQPPGFDQPIYSLATRHAANSPNIRIGESVDWIFWACSGAVVENVTATEVGVPWGHDRHSQLKQPSITEDVDLVTISIGGNDIGFADGVAECFGHACLSTAPEDRPSGASFVDEYEQRIDDLPTKLVPLYEEIKAAMPAARVLVVGYPQLFPFTGPEQGCLKLRPWRGEQNKLRELGSRLNQRIAESANAAAVEFVSVEGAFIGHEVCGANGEWIHGPSADWKKAATKCAREYDCSRRNVPADKTFHPNARGHAAGYAWAVNTYLERNPIASD